MEDYEYTALQKVLLIAPFAPRFKTIALAKPYW